jgi:hypothetical protein
MRLMFVVLAAVACWAIVMAVGWLALKRLAT